MRRYFVFVSLRAATTRHGPRPPEGKRFKAGEKPGKRKSRKNMQAIIFRYGRERSCPSDRPESTFVLRASSFVARFVAGRFSSGLFDVVNGCPFARCCISRYALECFLCRTASASGWENKVAPMRTGGPRVGAAKSCSRWILFRFSVPLLRLIRFARCFKEVSEAVEMVDVSEKERERERGRERERRERVANRSYRYAASFLPLGWE